MRLIDADALIEDLEFDVELDAKQLDCMGFVGNERDFVQFDKDCKQNAIDLLQNAPTISTPHWTPVSEGLPDTVNDYLVSIKGTTTGWVSVATLGEDDWYMWESEITPADITAWMPLPEPYKGEQT